MLDPDKRKRNYKPRKRVESKKEKQQRVKRGYLFQTRSTPSSYQTCAIPKSNNRAIQKHPTKATMTMTGTAATKKKKQGQKQQQRGESSSDWGDEVTRLLNEKPEVVRWQTTVRESLAPYLPPPVTRSIRQLDPLLEPYVGVEATVTIGTTIVAAWLLAAIVSYLLHRRRSAGTRRIAAGGKVQAVVMDEEEKRLEQQLAEEASATVLLVGSRKAGKTRLFCQLVYNIANQETVMSLNPNVAVVNDVKYIDWPGHHGDFHNTADLRHVRNNLRVILLVDATQPARIAADKLFSLLDDILWPRYQKYGRQQRTPVFVACHKKDLPKAKNEKRIKIQLRTELERLVQARRESSNDAVVTNGDTNQTPHNNVVEWWPTNDRLELDQIAICSFYFGPTTCEGGGCPELVKFGKTGIFPKDSS
jgi:signal recognition particle receptor subunit beta